ncbi:M48 family metalloprotease [Streptomyces sp. NPDC127098]|uniref:M48 family metalloprotease n=1 Tax=Streptomyces sp. NPDC127098 TaxID=3347137 RepID=UPI003659B443
MLIHLPHFLCSFFIVGAVAFAVFGDVLGWLLTAGWVLSGGLVFHRPTERRFAHRLLKLRPPTAEEFSYLAPIWIEICKRAQVDHTVYELWIEESGEINAVAAAGHIVGVTRHSVTTLPPGQLAAVLAHELGHHVGGHPWAGLMGTWYALPTRVTWFLLRLLTAAVFWIARKTFCLGGFAVLFAMLVTFAAAVLTMPFVFVPMLLSPYILAAVSRRAELRADEKAAQLGFAPTLVEVLRQADLAERAARGSAPRGRQGLIERLLRSHPSAEVRIERLRRSVGPAG